MALSRAQLLSLAIAPKLPALLSVLASSWIVTEVLTNPRKRSSLYHRIMLGFASVDIIFSIFAFASTWPIPRDAAPAWSAGNGLTCTVQGFMMQLSSACFTYVSERASMFPLSSLAAYLQDCISHCISHRMLSWLCISSWQSVGALATSISRPKSGFFMVSLWVSALELLSTLFTMACLGTQLCGAGSPPNTKFIVGLCTTLSSGLVESSFQWACWPFIVVPSSWEKDSSNKRELKNRQSKPMLPSSAPSKWLLKQVSTVSASIPSCCVWPCILKKVAVFYLTYMFGTINRAYQAITGKFVFALVLLHSGVLPFQGVLNLYVYRRQYMVHLRSNHPDWSRLQIWKKAFTITAFQVEE